MQKGNRIPTKQPQKFIGIAGEFIEGYKITRWWELCLDLGNPSWCWQNKVVENPIRDIYLILWYRGAVVGRDASVGWEGRVGENLVGPGTRLPSSSDLKKNQRSRRLRFGSYTANLELLLLLNHRIQRKYHLYYCCSPCRESLSPSRKQPTASALIPLRRKAAGQYSSRTSFTRVKRVLY